MILACVVPLGQYDLSGALFAYDEIAGLAAAMKSAGMQDWRVGVGRWEIATQLCRKLTDGTDLRGHGGHACWS